MRLLLVILGLVFLTGCTIKVKHLKAPGFEIENGYIGVENTPEAEETITNEVD